jgi:hypothetical protein
MAAIPNPANDTGDFVSECTSNAITHARLECTLNALVLMLGSRRLAGTAGCGSGPTACQFCNDAIYAEDHETERFQLSPFMHAFK